ncbi:MAG: hypothetical protein VYE67_13735 [Planctomycetota bacterium]|nr:hypothetical protein [Planctomycetota bacterium]
MRFVIENHRYVMTMIPVFALVFFAGCGPNYDEDQILDPLKLAQKLDANASDLDPAEFVEIELHPVVHNTQIEEKASCATIDIRFQAYIVVPKASEKTMKETISNRRFGLMEDVKEVVRQSDMGILSDPDLDRLKSTLVEALRQELGEEIRDVVFAQFSIR